MDSQIDNCEKLYDPETFDKFKAAIENHLSDMKKMADRINQMRVEAAYLESDLLMMIDSSTWQNISEFIGLNPIKKIVMKEESDATNK